MISSKFFSNSFDVDQESRTDKIIIAVFAFVCAVLVLLMCTQSSPLYPMNRWCDTNAEMSMGHAVLEGKVPFRDVYDHRGPLLHFIYALACLISGKSHFGLFLIETALFSMFLFYTARIARLYLKTAAQAAAATIPTAVVTASSTAFGLGGAPEEFVLPLIAAALFFALRAVRNNTFLKRQEIFAIGIFAGCIFWIKYTMLGFFIGLVLFVIIWEWVCNKNIKRLMMSAALFLLGVCAVSVGVLTFFLIKGGISDLFEVYFFDNFFNYGHAMGVYGIIHRVLSIGGKQILITDAGFGFMLVCGIIWALFCTERFEKALLFITAFFTFLTAVCLSSYYTYYRIVLFVFAIFGSIALIGFFLSKPELKIRNKSLKIEPVFLIAVLAVCAVMFVFSEFIISATTFVKLNWLQRGAIKVSFVTVSCFCTGKFKGKTGVAVCMLLLCALPPLCFYASTNTYFIKYAKSDLVQYKFAEIINSEENNTLLCYNMMDEGFYQAANQAPRLKYFYKPNVHNDVIMNTAKEYIENEIPDFIVTEQKTTEEHNNEKYNLNNYILIEQCEDAKHEYIYYLYKLSSHDNQGNTD